MVTFDEGVSCGPTTTLGLYDGGPLCPRRGPRPHPAPPLLLPHCAARTLEPEVQPGPGTRSTFLRLPGRAPFISLLCSNVPRPLGSGRTACGWLLFISLLAQGPSKPQASTGQGPLGPDEAAGRGEAAGSRALVRTEAPVWMWPGLCGGHRETRQDGGQGGQVRRADPGSRRRALGARVVLHGSASGPQDRA